MSSEDPKYARLIRELERKDKALMATSVTLITLSLLLLLLVFLAWLFSPFASYIAGKIDSLSSALDEQRSQFVPCADRPNDDPDCKKPTAPDAERIAPKQESDQISPRKDQVDVPIIKGDNGERGPRGFRGP